MARLPARTATVCVILLLLCASPSSRAGESSQGEEPAPASVKGLRGPFARALRERIEEETLFPNLKEWLEEQAPFLRDSHATLKSRTYYFDRDRADGTRSEAWAIGGAIDYATGWYRDMFSLGLGYYQSEKLVGDADRDGTLLLAPGQEGLAVLGKAYAAFRSHGHQAILYRQELDVPYVNRQDNRMLPNTFEAYKLDGRFSDVPQAGTVRYIAAYVDEMKRRNDDTFISMSEVAGVDDHDRGLVMTGFAVQPNPDSTLGVVNHFVDNTLNISYAEIDVHHRITEEVELRYQGQYTHQQSVGDDLLTGEDFETQVWSGRLATSYKGWVLKAAFSTTDDEQKIRSPFGSYPGYISLMQQDFNRAGEDAWLVGASYDLGQLGLTGVSVFANYAEGHDALDVDSGSSLPDEQEFDITADYRVPEGRFGGLWLRARWSTLDRAGNTDDFRVIVNYEIPIL